MAKRIGDSGAMVDVLLVGGIAVGAYFLVIKPLLSGIGIDPASAATISAEQNLPPAQNPFNYQFQPFVDFYNENNPGTVGDSSFWAPFEAYLGISPAQVSNPTVQQFFQYLKASPGQPSPWGYIDTNVLSNYAETLYSSVTGFVLLTTDQSTPMSIAQQLTNQLSVAFIANYWWWNFNADMISTLQGSLTKPGLTPQNLAAFITRVNGLPLVS